MSFDRKTGELWTGDVGQNAWEEIDIITRGGNYGWKNREGRHEFKKAQGDESPSIDPVHEYGRRSGGSITGGYVYRGSNIPHLVGTYIFSDYLSKRIWGLSKDKENTQSYVSTRIAKKTPIAIASFGETRGGEILACGFPNPYSSKGKIYLLLPSDSTASMIR
jgi:glucose/arabinose dehydrogenase